MFGAHFNDRRWIPSTTKMDWTIWIPFVIIMLTMQLSTPFDRALCSTRPHEEREWEWERKSMSRKEHKPTHGPLLKCYSCIFASIVCPSCILRHAYFIACTIFFHSLARFECVEDVVFVHCSLTGQKIPWRKMHLQRFWEKKLLVNAIKWNETIETTMNRKIKCVRSNTCQPLHPYAHTRKHICFWFRFTGFESGRTVKSYLIHELLVQLNAPISSCGQWHQQI